MKKIFVRRFSFVVAVIFVAAFFAFVQTNHFAKAQSSGSSLSGYAWSDNIGWISFSGTSPAYGVTEDGSGNLSGYAWSDSIGWIKFGGLSGFPSGSGTTNANAYIDSNNVLHGCARACAGTIKSGDSVTNPTQIGDCSTMTSRQDGWDGWISLDGSNYGVNFASGNGQYSQSAYTWGSDVIGWITFNPFNLASSTGSHSCDPTQEVCPGSGGGQPALSCSGTLNSSNQIVWTATVSAGSPQYLFTWSPGTGVSGSSATNQTTGTSTYTTGVLASSSPANSYSISVTATANGQTVTGASCPSENGPLSSNNQSGSMCTGVPANTTLCSGSATGNTSSSLVSSCTASGGTPLCQYTCNANSHLVGGQCVGNGTLQEQ